MKERQNKEGYNDPTAYAAMRRIEKGEAMSNGTFDIRRGDIFYVNRFPTVGGGIHTGRPAIVVSNNEINENNGTIEVVYLTTRIKPELPTHVRISSSARESIALCEQVDNVALERLGDYHGCISKEEMTRIDIALLVSLDLYTRSQEQMDDVVAADEKRPTEHEDTEKMAALMAERDAAIACKNDLEKKCVETGVRLADAENEIACLKEQLRMAAKMYSAMSELALK